MRGADAVMVSAWPSPARPRFAASWEGSGIRVSSGRARVRARRGAPGAEHRDGTPGEIDISRLIAEDFGEAGVRTAG